MRSLLHLADGVPEWTANPSETPGRRPIGTNGETLFRGGAESYPRALIRPDPWEDLVELGRQVYPWRRRQLHGWAAREEQGVTPPWIVSLVVPTAQQPLDAAFLEAPWEMLSDAPDLSPSTAALLLATLPQCSRLQSLWQTPKLPALPMETLMGKDQGQLAAKIVASLDGQVTIRPYSGEASGESPSWPSQRSNSA
jgi:hypothetical protein